MSTDLTDEDIPVLVNDGEGTRTGGLAVNRFYGGRKKGSMAQLTFSGYRTGIGEGEPSQGWAWIVLDKEGVAELRRVLRRFDPPKRKEREG